MTTDMVKGSVSSRRTPAELNLVFARKAEPMIVRDGQNGHVETSSLKRS